MQKHEILNRDPKSTEMTNQSIERMLAIGPINTPTEVTGLVRTMYFGAGYQG